MTGEESAWLGRPRRARGKCSVPKITCKLALMIGRVTLLGKKVSKAIGERGAVGTALLGARFIRGAVKSRLNGEVRRAEKYARAFDARHHVDTCGELSPLAMNGPPVPGDLGYNGVNFHEFKELFERIAKEGSVDYPKTTFVDIGSGKGRALLLASEWPFLAIRGVEVWPELHEKACANIASYRNENQRGRDLASVLLDARAYEFPETPLLVFAYEPFDSPAPFREIIDRLLASLSKEPRPLLIVAIVSETLQKVLDRPELERTYANGWQGIWQARSPTVR